MILALAGNKGRVAAHADPAAQMERLPVTQGVKLASAAKTGKASQGTPPTHVDAAMS
jgi:hypothetical protein